MLYEANKSSMQITHQMRKCWNESLQYILKHIEDNTNIGADALFHKKAVITSLMSNYVNTGNTK